MSGPRSFWNKPPVFSRPPGFRPRDARAARRPPSRRQHGNERRRREHSRGASAATSGRRNRRASIGAAPPRGRGRRSRRRPTNAPSGRVSKGASCRRCRRASPSTRSACSRRRSHRRRLVTRMQLVPPGDEAPVVLVAAERTGTMARSERRCLVEEEELREPSRLQQAVSASSHGTRAGTRSSACR